MKKFFLFATALFTLLTLASCCTGSCPEQNCLAGSWQMYGVRDNGSLVQTPVVMSFGNDGTVTTVIENKDVRKNIWKKEGKYIIIYQDKEPTVRLELKKRDQIEFEWRGGKYAKKPLQIVLKRK